MADNLKKTNGEIRSVIDSRPAAERPTPQIEASGASRPIPEDILPMGLCQELLGSRAVDLGEENLGAVRECALALAEIVAQAYVDFRAEAPDVDPEEIRATGSLGMAKLMGIEVSEDELDAVNLDAEGGSDGE